jgi:endonuclease/exonuclease/phosphatase family metal-dependent hydrolase
MSRMIVRKTAMMWLALGVFMLCPGLSDAGTIKIATWNLDWLTLREAGDPALPDDVHPRKPGDFDRLRGFADHLDADVVAFQEVDGIAAASRIFDPARYTLVAIDEDVVQRVGLAVRRGILVQRHPDVAALDVEPLAVHRLRDGLDATLVFPGGAALRVLVVHLKTGCHRDRLASSRRPQCALLTLQIPVVAAWIRARAAENGAFAVMGDFNRDMDRPEDMSASFMAAAPLVRVTEGQSNPCWGAKPFIDTVFLGGLARAWAVPGSLRVMTYGDAGIHDRDRLSDHCPVSVRLAPKG